MSRACSRRYELEATAIDPLPLRQDVDVWRLLVEAVMAAVVPLVESLQRSACSTALGRRAA